MKRLLLLTAFIVCVLSLKAQTGTVRTFATNDTLQGAETVNFGPLTISGSYNALTIQALCTEIGGTADGTLWIDVSVDGTSYETLTESDGADFFPNDTLTIVDAAVWTLTIKDAPWKYYKIVGTGTSGDTTLITTKYILK